MIRFPFLLLSAGFLFLAGCSATPHAAKTESKAPPQPTLATSVRIASIDLARYSKRFEKKEIERFAAILKREQVEILAVQGITRYPNLKTRVDFVSELAAQMEMRHTFGESTDIMGRQLGNAVFSVYPIRSNLKKEYDVPSAFSEYALRVAIDAGVRDVTIVSTWLPQNASAEDLSRCVQTIAELREPPDAPFIVAGNLPGLKQVRGAEAFTDVQSTLPDGAAKQLTSRMWYAQRDLFRLIQARTVKTDFGTMTAADFGLYQQPKPL